MLELIKFWKWKRDNDFTEYSLRWDGEPLAKIPLISNKPGECVI